MSRTILFVPFAMIVSAGFLFAAAGPAIAAPACADRSTEIRTAAATAAGPEAARKALRYASIGQKLCEAGNERAATKKFDAAANVLGIDESRQLASQAGTTGY